MNERTNEMTEAPTSVPVGMMKDVTEACLNAARDTAELLMMLCQKLRDDYLEFPESPGLTNEQCIDDAMPSLCKAKGYLVEATKDLGTVRSLLRYVLRESASSDIPKRFEIERPVETGVSPLEELRQESRILAEEARACLAMATEFLCEVMGKPMADSPPDTSVASDPPLMEDVGENLNFAGKACGEISSLVEVM